VTRARRWATTAGLAATFGALGCEVPHARPDGAVGDAQAMDAQATDAQAMDSASDVALSHPACDTVIDLEREATRADGGNELRWSGNNADTPDGVANALQPSSSCDFRAIRQRLFRYRLRSDAALRVSTNNPGSEASFDSSVFITTAPCGPSARVLACNDDDPFAPRNPHVTLSLATTAGLRMGTEVIISVSGFYPAAGGAQGPNPNGEIGVFELSVTEIPSRPVGETCDTSGRADVCVLDAHCIADDTGRGRCVRDGSLPGALCGPDASCAAGLTCEVERNTCFAAATMVGATCEVGASANRCASGLSCVTALRGQRRGACARNGTLLAACAASDGGAGVCDDGLRCDNGVCKRSVSDGAACNARTDACPSGRSCVATAANGAIGTCVPNGTAHNSACRDSGSECDAPLFCIVNFARERTCRTVGRASGDRCDNGGVCSFENPCVTSDPSRPTEGVCRFAGEVGTECSNDAGCTGGRRCVGRTANALGRCLPIVSASGACDVARRTDACDAGLSCVRSMATGSEGTCVPVGTRPGAACRAAAPQCDAGLSCATDLGTRCVASAARGAACDPRFNTARCASGTYCIASDFDTGACGDAPMEVEPNDVVTGAAATGATVAARGGLPRFDVDCFAMQVPADGSVFAQAVGLNGQCNNNLVLDLYRGDGTWLGTDSDAGPASCPRVEGSAYPWARGLAEGTYAVCVREANNGIVGGYVLSARGVARP
jgi:hypothetical protein